MTDLEFSLLCFLVASIILNAFQYREVVKLQATKDKGDALNTMLNTELNHLRARQVNNAFVERENKNLRQTVQRYQSTINQHHPD